MTDHHDPMDDLASAHLDGETSSAEAASVMSDARLLARVERLREVRGLLRGAEVTIDPEGRDRAIAAALAAFEAEEIAALPAEGDRARVHALAPAAVRRRSRRAIELVGIAAAVALLALAVPLLGQLDSGSHDDVTATGGQTSDEGAVGAAPSAKGTGPTTFAESGAPVAHLGSFADLPHLADAIRSELSGTSGYASEPGQSAAGDRSLDSSVAPCADERARAGAALYTALAELHGQSVIVIVRDDPGGGRSIVVLDATDCTTIATDKV